MKYIIAVLLLILPAASFAAEIKQENAPELVVAPSEDTKALFQVIGEMSMAPLGCTMNIMATMKKQGKSDEDLTKLEENEKAMAVINKHCECENPKMDADGLKLQEILHRHPEWENKKLVIKGDKSALNFEVPSGMDYQKKKAEYCASK